MGAVADILSSHGQEGVTITALAINPATPTTLYAGTFFGVFKSMDSGRNWTKVNTGAGVEVAALAIDPETPTTLYAGGHGDPFYKSKDGGGTWSASSNNQYIYALAINQETPSIIHAGTLGGVLKSTDGGINWILVNTGLPDADVFALTVDPVTPTTLYAGTSFGVFKSTDAGYNWSAANTGLAASLFTP